MLGPCDRQSHARAHENDCDLELPSKKEIMRVGYACAARKEVARQEVELLVEEKENRKDDQNVRPR